MKVFLDPGHGGRDPGVTENGFKESELVLEDALDVAALLANAGVEVKLSRNKDVFVSLHERANMANEWGADIFVSFHINSPALATGTETWFYHEHSRALAEKMQKTLVHALNLPDRGIKQKGFVVIRFPRMPAVLMEPFFLGNAHNLNRYLNRREQYRVNMANAILDYLDIKTAPKRRYNMVQPSRVHHHIISHGDSALHVKNIHPSKAIKVRIKEFNEDGVLLKNYLQTITHDNIYSLSLKTAKGNDKFGSYLLTSLAKFVSRVE